MGQGSPGAAPALGALRSPRSRCPQRGWPQADPAGGAEAGQTPGPVRGTEGAVSEGAGSSAGQEPCTTGKTK